MYKEEREANITDNMKENAYVFYNQAIAFLGKLIEYADDIDAILMDVAEHYDADRAYVFEFSHDRKTIDNTYEWCRDGIEPQIDVLQAVPYESVAVWVEEFERVGAFFISALNKDVDADSLTYEILEPQGIESLIAAPIFDDNKIIGFIGVDNPHKNTDDIVILKATASLLYSEISRKIAKKSQTIKEITKANEKQDAELGEIKDIIASASMGTWRIELVENENPRMYVDETMRKLLGIEGKNESPEKTYTDWFSNITPEAVPSVFNSVELMKQGYNDENTYLWKHPTKGVRYVRCGGTSKNIPGGYSLQGYHYDVDEVVRREQKQMHKLQKALEDKKEYYNTLGTLGDIFYSMHVIDLLHDQVFPFNSKGKVAEIVNDTNGATLMMDQIMRTATVDEHREKALEFTDLRTIPDRMKGKKIISHEFIGRSIGWFLASFITMEADENKRPTKVIYTTRIIDEEKKEQEKLLRKTQTDEMTGLLNRRAYEEKIYEHNDVPEEDKFIYVSIDANGLKHINDTIGHAAGDEMLIGVAQCMKKSLGPCGHLYRIGGDEFIAILFLDNDEIKAVLEDFDKTLNDWSGKLVDRLSVSYGWVNKKERPDASTRQLGAIAEARMYEAKSAYYKKQGVDRRGQQDAHKALCALYTKILKINISDDTYQIVNMNDSEQTLEKGFSNKISEWLSEFGKSGQVHPDDLDEYLKMTDLQYMKEYFGGNKTSLHIFYRRKYDNEYKQVLMEIIPADDFAVNDMNLFLYVKSIEK